MESTSFDLILHWVGSLGLLAACFALFPSRKPVPRPSAIRSYPKEGQRGKG